ncbi:MAG TPA: hypothetical protein VHJ18_24755 [Streptosporangiaceae bacterium]|jgi:hypothetical protein|nr:hypothetical protein [Streptosporangiaceae bacterium]
MTASAPPAGLRGEPLRPAGEKSARVAWRRLAWVTWRQQRTALAGLLALPAVAAIAMAAIAAPDYGSSYTDDPARVGLKSAVVLLLQLTPVLAGLFIGAPLIAREAEQGTLRLAWTLGADRTRWLLCRTVPVMVLLALAAAGLGLELRWWLRAGGWAVLYAGGQWLPQFFSLNPLPFAGWVTLSVSIGLLLGAAIRRTVPAMAATLACYAALLSATSLWWRHGYLSPLLRAVPHATIVSGGGYGYGVGFSRGSGPGPYILGTRLGWPDGRPLSASQLNHTAAWFREHHIAVWMTYQPSNRYSTFQFIEFGWLVALSALLVGLTVVLISRRAA